MLVLALVLLLLPSLAFAQAPLTGDVSAVYDLIGRVLPSESASDHFHLKLGDCGAYSDDPRQCFRLQDGDDRRLVVTATTASELSAGVGYYLRNHCNMTIGWPRGGGSNIFVPEKWPAIGADPITKRRIAPWSYLMNVCTHSYSLAFYNWNQWEEFIDWMSLTGINLMLALTGQEEVQYKVFSKLGVADEDIRSWFNGPGFLAWSRGQNEYGSGICGPLPRSFMKAQWEMQKTQILPRLRSLGITGQLPEFQGNVPIQLKEILHDYMTRDGDTGWRDSLDPNFGKVADLWIKTLIEDFGTDHWYQMDGYFDGSTAPWRGSKQWTTTEWKDHHKVTRDELAYRRGAAAYTGLNRTDPSAVWSFQGWAIVGWSTPEEAGILKGFVDSAPKDKLVIIDMSRNGIGEWKQWQNASFFGAPFVWTTLNNFGGTAGMKGNLSLVNRIPFDGPDLAIGTGATPEGIDQNPAYYEFVFEQNFRNSPVDDIHAYLINRSHRRHGLPNMNEKVATAWSLLADSAYAEDLSTQDNTGLSHLLPYGGDDASMFERDRTTPNAILCTMVEAWKLLIEAAENEPQLCGSKQGPFTYDLVNLGREVLAQISTPAVLNFSDATEKPILDKHELMKTGMFYTDILNDIDKLVGSDIAFLLGPFLESARRLGRLQYDCFSEILEDSDCEHFYEWNARSQITTWNPTPKGSAVIPGGPIDYASKHWSGLIRDYYMPRATLLMKQALKDQVAARSLNQTEVSRLHAKLAYEWTTDENKYTVLPDGDAVSISRTMYEKYANIFTSCERARTNDAAESPQTAR